jgi:two-component system, chemotaxis family, CheB/CheR fusion protein
MADIFEKDIIPADDADRLEALSSFNLLYTPREKAFDTITEMMGIVFNAPLTFVSLVDKDIVFYKSQIGGFGRDQVERKDSLCSFTILQDEVLVVQDAREINVLKENPYVAMEEGIRFYAGAPLITPEGHHLGTVCVVDTTPRSFTDEQKRLLSLFGEMVMHEIEQRLISQSQYILQQELDKAQVQLTTALKAGKVTTWDWDLVKNLITGNDDLAQMFCQDKSAILAGVDPESLFPLIHPDDLEAVRASVARSLETGKDYEAEYRIVRQTGIELWLHARGQVQFEEGVPKSLTGIVIDMTDKKEIEKELMAKNQELQILYEELRFVTDTMPQLVWATDPNGSPYFFNKVWMEYTGMKPEEIEGAGWLRYVHPDDVDLASRRWTKAIQTGNPYETEYRLKSFDGTYKWFLARGTPMKDSQGVIQKWYGSTTDIQDHKMTNHVLEQYVSERTRELNEANAHLMQLNAELEQFSFVSHHDLREPIRKILIFTQLLESNCADSLSEANREVLGKVIATAQRMNVALSDILNYATLGRVDELKSLDLNSVLADVKLELELFAMEKRATVDVGPLPVIKAISHLMHQLFYNLINNALKFSRPDCPPVIRVCARLLTRQEVEANKQLTSGINYYEINVEDNGIGFEEVYSERIFRLFQRLHSRDNYQGTGIGLALVKKVVASHGGSISVKSTVGQGSVFSVVLPAETL